MPATKTSQDGKGSRARARAANGSRGAGSKAGAAKEAVGEQAGRLREAASKVGAPVVAGGAVLAGLAGAAAISRNSGGKGPSLSALGRKRRSRATRKALRTTAKAFGDTAVAVGKAGYRVGELSAEIRRVREQALKQR